MNKTYLPVLNKTRPIYFISCLTAVLITKKHTNVETITLIKVMAEVTNSEEDLLNATPPMKGKK